MMAALGLLLVVLLGAAVFLYVKVRDAREIEARDAAIVAAARAEALAFTDFDYRRINEQIDRVLAGSTGAFREQFKARADDLRKLSRQNRSVSKGKVLEAGLIPGSSATKTVLVVADSSVSNVSTKSPQPRHFRMSLEMVLEDGTWKTSKLEFVG